MIIDVIDTGGTLVRAAQALTDRSATQVIITDTLPNPASIPSSRLVVLSNAALPVRAISELFLEGSVTSLSEGES
ncbi:hypothetical protein ACBR40_05415 [Nonomuraea sp. AD125B]|uniref:hypothetical protein n=1 Tax=Nonomuraea sp. AD125B TaxID=3242897 RepID=UPI0035291D5D